MIIDISEYNKITDFEKIKAHVEGVIIRMGYTGYKSGKIVYDKVYHSNVAVFKDIPIGVYFLPQSITADEAIKEADFIRKSLPDNYPLGVWLDSEYAEPHGNGRGDKLTPKQRTAFLLIIINRLKSYGIPCGVYASTSWLNNRLCMDMLPGVPVWVAQYNKACTYKGDFILWQYTSKGQILGISGNVDCSIKVNTPTPVMDAELESAIDVIAKRIINGEFGKGHDNRARNIYNLIRSRVNDILK